MVRAGQLLLIAAFGLVLTGCVERRFVIATEPFGAAGAAVYDMADNFVGFTPTDMQFTYYGKYRFKIVKEGYKTMIVEERVKAPWYEWPILDFVSENVIPFTVRDRRELRFMLEPLEPASESKVRSDGEQLRQRGMTIGTP
jgi:hypothetical protein